MYKDLKNKILAAAKKKGLNQSELLAKINISQPGFDRMFINDSMKLRTLEDIAQVLELPLSYFLEDGNSSATKYVDSGNKYIDELIETQNKLIKSLETRVMEYENRLNNNNLQTA